MAIYGDTGEIPLSLKGIRLMLTYWYRITNLSNNTLVKKALLENINLRTNWIVTIEKLLNSLNLTDSIENRGKFKRTTEVSIQSKYTAHWNKKLKDVKASRLKFYDSIKTDYLILGN